MNRTMRIGLMLTFIMLQVITTGCWGHREIEDQSVYIGLGLDVGSPSKFEQEVNEQGGHYPKMNTVTVTVQIARPEVLRSKAVKAAPHPVHKGGPIKINS